MTRVATGALLLLELFSSNVNAKISSEGFTSLMKSFWQNEIGMEKLGESSHRHLDQSQQLPRGMCESALVGCVGNDDCFECFADLREANMDWARVTSQTQCTGVVDIIRGHTEHCSTLEGNARESFCMVFDACSIWQYGKNETFSDGEGDSVDNRDEDNSAESSIIDCNSLTECNWDGIHPSFVGDGICHQGLNPCYNTEVCGYDGGDCCSDTCKERSDYVRCGQDFFACRDPTSKVCDPFYAEFCESNGWLDDDVIMMDDDMGWLIFADDDDDNFDNEDVENEDDEDRDPYGVYEKSCNPGLTLYRLELFDSFGDGWDSTTINITEGETIIYQGKLDSGFQGTKYICLFRTPSCYEVNVGGGQWSREVSWMIHGPSEGSPKIAGGFAPTTCKFPVSAGFCENTCLEGSKDYGEKNYQTYEKLETCIKKSCSIQFQTCADDEYCKPCLDENVDANCHSLDNFIALSDCTICQCTESKDKAFCRKKASPGEVAPSNQENKQQKFKRCTAAQTIDGVASMFDFSSCIDFDKVSMLLTDFDENHFGALDTFEACAHKYNDSSDHGGHSALSCLQQLVNAMSESKIEHVDFQTPVGAVSALASHVYNDGEEFCKCTAQSQALAPLCPSFVNYKTLLYETVDACHALDEIDCGAWREFAPACKSKMISKLGSFDLTKEDHCKFFAYECNDIGPFPRFAKKDCYGEIPAVDWDIYSTYARECLNQPLPEQQQQQPETAPKSAPIAAPITQSPVTSPVMPVPAPVPNVPSSPDYKPISPSSDYKPTSPSSNYTPTSQSSDYKPISPKNTDVNHMSGEQTAESSPEDTKKKRTHRLRNFVLFCLLAGGAFIVYKKRSDGFSFSRYRRMQRNFGDDDMYSGLSLEGSTSFQPVTLPPRPIEMHGNYAL